MFFYWEIILAKKAVRIVIKRRKICSSWIVNFINLSLKKFMFFNNIKVEPTGMLVRGRRKPSLSGAKCIVNLDVSVLISHRYYPRFWSGGRLL